MRERLDVVGQVLTCTNCRLHSQCVAPVPLRGPNPAKVAVLGDWPGPAENKTGEAFRTEGRFLTTLLRKIGITDVAYLYTVACHPHSISVDTELVAKCDDNKQAQLDLINPRVVLVIGRTALHPIRPDIDYDRYDHFRGRPFMHQGRLHFATHHPARALRDEDVQDALRHDLFLLRRLLKKSDWHTEIPDTCSHCTADAEWWEAESGLGWCPTHLVGPELTAYQARQALLEREERELAKSRTASEQWQAEMGNARAARDQAIATVDMNADQSWKIEAYAALRWCAIHYPEFTADEVWTRLNAVGLESTHEPAALGPQFLRAARDRIIEKTTLTRPTHYARRHRDLVVWRSRLYQGDVA